MAKNKKQNNKTNQPKTTATLNNGYESLIASQMPQNNTLFQPYTMQENARYNLSTTMNWYNLISYYTTYSFVKNFIDIPVEDAFSKGIEILSNELNDEDINKFNQFLEENNVLTDIKQAIKWTRLFGGGGILINESSKSNWGKEFDLKHIKKGDKITIYPVQRWELFSVNMYDNANEILNYLPEQPFFIRGYEVHPSRFFKMRNEKLPFPFDAQVQGWGMSEIEKVMDSVNMFIKTKKALFELIDENKIDVYYKNGLAENLISPEGEAAVKKQMALTNSMKNFQNALVLDGLDKWEQKLIPFTGWADMIRELRIDLCAALCMPATKLWGVALISNLGMNSEGDIDNYNIMLESKVRQHAKPLVLYILKIYMLSFFGFIPDDLKINFPNLKNISAVEEQANKRDKTNILLNLYDRGLLNVPRLEEALKKEDIVEVNLNSDANVPESQAEYGAFNKITQQNSKRYSFIR